jgi:hypothetical protein
MGTPGSYQPEDVTVPDSLEVPNVENEKISD